MKEPDAYITGETDFSELSKRRQMDIIGELLKRGDLQAIQALGVKIMTDEEWLAARADEPPDVIEIKSLN